MSEKELSIELLNWFKLYGGKKDCWNKTHVGKVLKSELDNLGNWKNAPRGNPRAGGRASKLERMKRENPGWEEEPIF